MLPSDLMKKRLPGRPPNREVLLFLRNLGVMLKAGVPVTRSLHSLALQTSHPVMRDCLEWLRNEVLEGKPLSQAVQSLPHAFDQFVVAFLRVGEASDVVQAIEGLTVYYEKQSFFQRKVLSALVYPAFALTVATVLLTAISSVCSTMLLPFFESLGIQLNGFSRLVLGIGGVLANWRTWLLGGLILASAWKWLPRLRQVLWARLEPVVLRWKFVRALVQARFARSLEMLVSVGHNLNLSIGLAGRTIGFESTQEDLAGIVVKIRNGESLGNAFAHAEVFDSLFAQLIRVGEETPLDVQLKRLAETYEALFEERVDALLAWVDPALMMVLGIVTAGFILAVGAPMAQVMGRL